MANEKMRITQLPTAPQVEDNDYLPIDNTSTPTAENEGGTRKILVKDITAKSADAVDYDNTASGLEADNVQDAIDEVLEEGGKVQDVYENGESVVDPTDKIARIHGHKEVTQAQYDALPSSKLTDGIMYCIKDAEFSAEDVPYDNSDSGLESEDVQSAIDEIADVLGALKVEGTVENQSIATFTDGSALPMPKLEIAVEPQQEGSGDPSPTNIRPISGYTEANVTKCGKNVATTEIYKNNYVLASDGSEKYASGFIITKEIKIDSSKSCYLSVIGEQSSSTDAIRVGFYDKFLNFISRTERSTPTPLTIPNNAEYIRLSYRNIAPYFKDIQIEFNNQQTTYEPYNGQTYTTTLKDGQGNPMTCYGGQLDVVSGVLTVNRANVDLGTLDWIKQNTTSGNWRFKSSQSIQNIKLPIDASSKFDNLCSVYQNVTANETWAAENTGIAVNADGSLLICDLNQVDTTALGVVIANQTYCYELATPTTIQLTPTVVNSLLGSNNIWADCGKINKAVYIRDLNIVINNLLNA